MLARDHRPGSDPPLLALRAEGGPGRGVGHLARCLALAQAWVARGGSCVLVAASVPEPWAQRYAAAGVEVVAPGTELAPQWWLVDGYDLDDHDRPEGARLARIDDHGLSPVGPAEVLVDQNLGASPGTYQGCTAYAQLGSRYALLRQELVAAAAAASDARLRNLRSHQGPLRLVVAMGGAPADRVRSFFEAVLVELADDDLAIRVLSGGVDPAPAYAEADLALAAAGSTCWELGLFGVPSVLVAVAPNQVPLGQALAANRAGRYVGELERTSPAEVAAAVRTVAGSSTRRAELSAAIAHLIDGRGAARVATRLRGGLVQLRRAGGGDVELVHRINDEPGVRAASFDTGPIPWDVHREWFARRLADPAHHLFLGTDHRGELLGLVRFAVDARVAEIGVALDVTRRGQGWGPALVDAGVRRLADELGSDGLVRVEAQVKATNAASLRAFIDADFDAAVSDDPAVKQFRRVPVAWSAG